MNPGWQRARDVGPIAGTDRCEYHHLGVRLSGVLRVEMQDGETVDVGPQEAFEIPPGHLAWVVGDEPWVAIDFRGARSYARLVSAIGDRVLETILFTDIVDSTGTLHRIGDAAWRDLLARHNELMREQLDRFRGRDIGSTGDGILAVFDGAARAVECAVSMTRAVGQIGRPSAPGPHRRGGARPRRTARSRGPPRQPGDGHSGAGRGSGFVHDRRSRGRIRHHVRNAGPARVERDSRGAGAPCRRSVARGCRASPARARSPRTGP